jgi:hypothetical protein
MLLFLTLACNTPAPTTGPEPEVTADVDPHAGLDYADPAACGTCHQGIVSEWEESMHARAHASKDPIFAGMSALRAEKQGEQVLEKCGKCHRPTAVDAPDSDAAKAGVSCGGCHAENALAATEAVCQKCHAAAKNPQGAPTCTTGSENAELGGPSCVSCHMKPAEDGHAQHTFAGPHRAWYQDDPSMLKSAVAVSLKPGDDGALEVTVANTSGHGFPSGFPGRLASIRLVAGDWSETPESLVFKKVYVDADGKPTMPPFAAELKSDTRLTPGESRTVSVNPPADAGPVRAELVFHLIPPPAAKPLGLEGKPEAEPKVVVLATTASE